MEWQACEDQELADLVAEHASQSHPIRHVLWKPNACAQRPRGDLFMDVNIHKFAIRVELLVNKTSFVCNAPGWCKHAPATKREHKRYPHENSALLIGMKLKRWEKIKRVEECDVLQESNIVQRQTSHLRRTQNEFNFDICNIVGIGICELPRTLLRPRLEQNHSMFCDECPPAEQEIGRHGESQKYPTHLFQIQVN